MPVGTHAERRQWARYLVSERAEADVYRSLAKRRDGEEREILLALAEAEQRHEAHWLELLGGEPARLPRASARSRMLGFLARNFGSIFVLALAQNAEARSPYSSDPAATPAMAADERIHGEVVRLYLAGQKEKAQDVYCRKLLPYLVFYEANSEELLKKMLYWRGIIDCDFVIQPCQKPPLSPQELKIFRGVLEDICYFDFKAD